MKHIDKKNNNLYGIALLVLFITSYMPLFILIIFKQLTENYERLSRFGVGFILIASFLFIFFSFWGCKTLFSNFKKDAKNGDIVTIKNVSNRNSESIGYIATYIIPFMFQNFNSIYEIVAFFFLMIIIYRIYINSNLLLINPILSFKYSIFEIEYEEQNKRNRNGLIIIENTRLDEDSDIKIYPIGFKLFYAIKQ